MSRKVDDDRSTGPAMEKVAMIVLHLSVHL